MNNFLYLFSSGIGVWITFLLIPTFYVNEMNQPSSTLPHKNADNHRVYQVNCIQTWVEDIGSTDPGGLTYLPDRECLVLTDSEINEYSFFTKGDNKYNVFQISTKDFKANNKYLVGSQKGNSKVIAEPTGVIFNSNDHHYYITNDDEGTLKQYDSLFQFTGLSIDLLALQCRDAEGLAYNPIDKLYYISSGSGGSGQIFVLNEKFELNGVIEVKPHISDPEGLAFDPVSHSIFALSGGRENKLLQLDVSGQLLNSFSLDHLKPKPILLNALAIKPEYGQYYFHFYLGDRGYDNNSVPVGQYSEDGRIYEIFIHPKK